MTNFGIFVDLELTCTYPDTPKHISSCRIRIAMKNGYFWRFLAIFGHIWHFLKISTQDLISAYNAISKKVWHVPVAQMV